MLSTLPYSSGMFFDRYDAADVCMCERALSELPFYRPIFLSAQ